MNEVAIELLPLAIGIGLVVGLLSSEVFGLVPGGLVVPGYLALYLHRPLDVAITLLAALVTLGVVRALSLKIIIYGRRQMVLSVLVGFMIAMAASRALEGAAFPGAPGVAVIGFIVPGIIAVWLDRQGIVETLSCATVGAVLVRLVLIVAMGSELVP